MSVTSLPRFDAQLLAALGQAQVQPWTILIVGQLPGVTTAVSGQLYTGVQDMPAATITSLFGDNSELRLRINKARDVIQGRAEINVIALSPNAGAVDAERTITVTGTATSAGTIEMDLVDGKQFRISVDIASGTVQNDIATAINAAITSQIGTRAPFANAVATNVVTLTARDGGTVANKYTVKVTKNTVGGVTLTDGQFSGGAADPVLTTLFDNVSATRFHSISFPWTTQHAILTDFLEPRNAINNSVLQGVGFIGLDDTEANITALVNGTTPLNSKNLVFMGNRTVGGVAQILTPPDWRVAEFLAIEALRQTPDALIGQYVTTSSQLDTIGGNALASLPYFNTPLALTDVAAPDTLFSEQAQENLEDDGFSIVGVNESKTRMITGNIVSTYKFNDRGDADVSFKYLNYIRTGYLALEYFFRSLKSTYAQSRLTGGDLVAGRSIANKESIRAEYINIYKILAGPAFTLTQAGTEALKFFNDNLNISVDLAAGKVTGSGSLPIVTQFRSGVISFSLAFNV
jgi:phage tail sheath gpL-like